MKTKIILLALALGASTCLLTAQDGNPPNDGQRPPSIEGDSSGPRFHVLPPGARERLNLTADQLKQVADLEAEVKAKMEKILTTEQLQQLAQMHPPRPGDGMGGGFDGGPPGSQGGEDRQQPPPEN